MTSGMILTGYKKSVRKSIGPSAALSTNMHIKCPENECVSTRWETSNSSTDCILSYTNTYLDVTLWLKTARK